MTDKQMSLPFIYLKLILRISAYRILIFVSFFVIFPMKITPALISMLMYSCLHLTSEYVMANYHYTGREIRALTEVLGMGTKGGQLCILAWGPKIVTEHLETGGV